MSFAWQFAVSQSPSLEVISASHDLWTFPIASEVVERTDTRTIVQQFKLNQQRPAREGPNPFRCLCNGLLSLGSVLLVHVRNLHPSRLVPEVASPV